MSICTPLLGILSVTFQSFFIQASDQLTKTMVSNMDLYIYILNSGHFLLAVSHWHYVHQCGSIWFIWDFSIAQIFLTLV